MKEAIDGSEGNGLLNGAVGARRGRIDRGDRWMVRGWVSGSADG